MNSKKSLKVLIIEEGERHFSVLKEQLALLSDFSVDAIPSFDYQRGCEIFKSDEINLCFVDGELGKRFGADFLKRLSQHREEIPIIVICLEEPDEKLLEDYGVNDLILREGITPESLNTSIRHAIENNEQYLQIKAQEEKYNNLFYNSLEAVFTVSSDFKIIECNQSFRQLFKIKNLTHFDFKKIFLEGESDNFFENLHSKESKRIRKRKIYNTKGEEIIAYFSLTSIPSHSSACNYLGIIHDVTELEQMQSRLAESEQQSMIQRMARIIGHEVRNPLTNILLATEEIKQDLKENEDALMMLDMIHRNSNRISDLIDNFLKNSRTLNIVKEETVLEKALKNAIDSCMDRIVLKKIQFSISGLEGETILLLDEEKITIAFTNILINAIEALEVRENPRLIVELKKSATEIEVDIQDNGVGMSEETIRNLYNPFFSNKQGGLGLGMSNTRNIFNVHNAIVSVESFLGEGTTFSITFPVENK